MHWHMHAFHYYNLAFVIILVLSKMADTEEAQLGTLEKLVADGHI